MTVVSNVYNEIHELGPNKEEILNQLRDDVPALNETECSSSKSSLGRFSSAETLNTLKKMKNLIESHCN